MTETVDVRTRGWNNPECCYQVWVDDSYEDDDGYWHSSGSWENKLKCECITLDAKHDKCKRCGLILEYP